MKIKKSYSTILLLMVMLAITRCSDKDKNDEMHGSDKVTIKKVELLFDVLPHGTYAKVRFTSQNTAYTFTTTGTIFKTEDGGNTWTQKFSISGMILYDMFFLDDLQGYIVGGNEINEGIILKTVDGGSTWESAYFNTRIISIWFTNSETGFVLGPKLLKTLDGGKTWNEQDLGYTSYNDINFFDEYVGLMACGNTILKTIDGGNNWAIINNRLGNSSIRKIQIFNNMACLLSSGTQIFTTTDMGATWHTFEPPSLNSVHFFNENNAIGVGRYWPDLGYFSNGVLYITNDGGKNWQVKHQYQADEFYSLEDIDYSNDSTALVVGQTSSCVIKISF